MDGFEDGVNEGRSSVWIRDLSDGKGVVVNVGDFGREGE